MTGWGEGLEPLPSDADKAAAGRRLLPLPTPPFDEDRLRRASRECLLAIATVDQALSHSGLTRQEVAGPRTALIYASASAYAAANWAFLHADASEAAYFPYTAPSAVPGEVTISCQITGPYLSFLSGANAGIEALWQAAVLLAQDQCDRVLVLGVETFAECEALYRAGRWLLPAPWVEAAICLVVEQHPKLSAVGYNAGSGPGILDMLEAMIEPSCIPQIVLCMPTRAEGLRMAQHIGKRWPDIPILQVHNRTGSCLAAMPLIGFQLALTASPPAPLICISQWGETWSILSWPSQEA